METKYSSSSADLVSDANPTTETSAPSRRNILQVALALIVGFVPGTEVLLSGQTTSQNPPSLDELKAQLKKAGITQLGDNGEVVFEPRALFDLTDAALNSSLHLTVFGRTSNTPDGKIIGVISRTVRETPEALTSTMGNVELKKDQKSPHETPEILTGTIDNLTLKQGQMSPAFANYKGILPQRGVTEEGIYTVEATRLIPAAEQARKDGYSMRLLGSDPEVKQAGRVQVIRANKIGNIYPQDFWIERTRNAKDLPAAVLEVIDRRS